MAAQDGGRFHQKRDMISRIDFWGTRQSQKPADGKTTAYGYNLYWLSYSKVDLMAKFYPTTVIRSLVRYRTDTTELRRESVILDVDR